MEWLFEIAFSLKSKGITSASIGVSREDYNKISDNRELDTLMMYSDYNDIKVMHAYIHGVTLFITEDEMIDELVGKTWSPKIKHP